jgi:hypothetical protein
MILVLHRGVRPLSAGDPWGWKKLREFPAHALKTAGSMMTGCNRIDGWTLPVESWEGEQSTMLRI